MSHKSKASITNYLKGVQEFNIPFISSGGSITVSNIDSGFHAVQSFVGQDTGTEYNMALNLDNSNDYVVSNNAVNLVYNPNGSGGTVSVGTKVYLYAGSNYPNTIPTGSTINSIDIKSDITNGNTARFNIYIYKAVLVSGLQYNLTLTQIIPVNTSAGSKVTCNLNLTNPILIDADNTTIAICSDGSSSSNYLAYDSGGSYSVSVSSPPANGIQTFIAGNSAYMKLYITAPENIIENVSSQISIKCGNVNLTDTNIIKGSLIKTTQGNRYTVTSIASPYVTTTPVITGRETIVSITDGEFYSVSGSDYGYKLNKVGTAMVTGSPAWILPRPYTSINFNNPSGLQSVSITDSLGSNAYSIDGTDNIIVGVVEYNQYCTEGIDYIKFLNIGRSAWTSAVSVSGTQGTFGVDIQLLSDGSFSYTSSNPTVIISQFGILYTFKRNSTSAYLSFGYLSTTHNGVGVALTVDNGSLNTYWVDPTVGASSAVSVNNYTANTVTNSTDSFALSISSTGVTKLINTTTGKVSISPYTYPYKIITSTVWKPTSTMTSQNKLDLSVYSYNFYNYGDLISLLKAYYVSNPSVIEYNDQSLYKLDQSTGGITPANLFSLPNAPNINKPLSFVIGLLSKNANNNAPSVWNLRAVTDSTHTLLKQNLMQYRFNSGAGTVDVTNNSGTDLNNVKVIVM